MRLTEVVLRGRSDSYPTILRWEKPTNITNLCLWDSVKHLYVKRISIRHGAENFYVTVRTMMTLSELHSMHLAIVRSASMFGVATWFSMSNTTIRCKKQENENFWLLIAQTVHR